MIFVEWVFVLLLSFLAYYNCLFRRRLYLPSTLTIIILIVIITHTFIYDITCSVFITSDL